MECRNFTGQPIYAQITKYLSKGEILRQSRSVGGERYGLGKSFSVNSCTKSRFFHLPIG